MENATQNRAASLLRAQREIILEVWESRARAEIEAARVQNRTALRDHLPTFLERLAKALDPRNDLENAADGTDVCDTHGKERADLSAYTIPQVLHEYSILRQCVFETLETAAVLERQERETVLLSFDAAARDAAAAFHELRTEREREKRREVEGEVERLEAESDVQKTFVATLTHDLRNPISSVRMALDLLLRELPADPEILSLAEMMARNLERTETMLLDLLDANRIKSGHRLPLDLERCDLTVLAKTTLAELLAVRGQGCILQARGEIWGYWSACRLRRVLDNLLDNAIKYGLPGGPITLSVQQSQAETTIVVHNKGTPIPLEDQATIFEPHYQLDGGDGRRASGWGLGLTLVKAVTEAHGGHVRIESEATSGTSFIVTLPNDARPLQGRPPVS